jgi:hypothetical protein
MYLIVDGEPTGIIVYEFTNTVTKPEQFILCLQKINVTHFFSLNLGVRVYLTQKKGLDLT